MDPLMTLEFDLLTAQQLLAVAHKVQHISESVSELYPEDRDVLLVACVMLRSAANKAKEGEA